MAGANDMSDVMERRPITWISLYQALSQEDQACLIQCWRNDLKGTSKSSKYLAGAWGHHAKKLASRMRVRPHFIAHLPEDKLVSAMAKHATAIIKDMDLWDAFFRLFYFSYRTKLMCDFLDAAGLEHNAEGGIDKKDQKQPDALIYLKAIQHIIAVGQPDADVRHYIQTLLLMDDGDEKSEWFHLHEAWAHYLEESPSKIHDAQNIVEDEPVEQGELLLPTSDIDEFTTLDEVIIRQIVAVTNGDLGSLLPEKLDDMLQELIQLNTNRTRNYFHLGFAESLIFDRLPDFKSQPAMNDERKGWYLCGALAGCVRRRQEICFDHLLKEHGDILQLCLKKPSPVAVALCNYLFVYLSDRGMHSLALCMLDLMITKVEESAYVGKGLNAAERLLREDTPEQALKYLTLLIPFIDSSQNECPRKLFMRIKRRYGQALQQLGQFKDAQKCLASLVASSTNSLPDILSDLALIKAGFKSIREVRLFSSMEQRNAVLEALKRSRNELNLAVGGLGGNAPNADYLLSIKSYLMFQKDNNEQSREIACDHARRAVAGMRASESCGIYEQFGLLGTAQFIEVSMLAHASDEANLPKVKSKWVSISEDAGAFPDIDLAFFLDGLALMDGLSVAEVAESIWTFHKEKAWDILEKSEALPIILEWSKGEFLSNIHHLINETNYSGEKRFRIARYLVDGMKDRSSDGSLNKIAEDALDVMEGLSREDKHLGKTFLQLMRNEFYAPFWSEEEALWARVQLARTIGDDEVCAKLLPDLFYLYRDKQFNLTLQILEQCKIWKVDIELIRQLRQALPICPSADDKDDVIADSQSTKPVRVVFVGGNEVQQRYDANVIHWFEDNMPHVRLTFEHTGWSSNWGRDLDRLLARIEESDAVVLMQMMRTTLGRHLRRKVTKPWIPCTGTGQGAMKMSIKEAVEVVARTRATQ